MARETFEDRGWLPEANSSNVITRINATSAVEAVGNHEPMSVDTLRIPRMGTVGVSLIPKGTAFPESTGSNDSILLDSQKLGQAVRLAIEDLDDSPLPIIEKKKIAWAGDYARYFDNACLGVNAVQNGTTIPFTSVYKAVTTVDASVGYTASANHMSTATTGLLDYDKLAVFLSAIEGGIYFDEANMVVIAHPDFKGLLRAVKDTDGQPLFVDTRSGSGLVNSILGYEIRFTVGAKVTALPSSSPAGAGGAKGVAGNPLMIAVRKDLLIVGDRSNPESVVIDGRDGLSALTEETILKLRARKAFALGDPRGAYVLERVTA